MALLLTIIVPPRPESEPTARFCPLTSNVPELTVSAPRPSALLLPACTMVPLRMVPPLKLFAPESAIRPVPPKVKANGPVTAALTVNGLLALLLQLWLAPSMCVLQLIVLVPAPDWTLIPAGLKMLNVLAPLIATLPDMVKVSER